MHRSIPRSALVSCVAAGVAAFSAGPALAAITATTQPATTVKATTATLNGLVSTGGVLTAYQFTFTLMSNPFQGSETPGGTIPAGTTAVTPVSLPATGLTPSTAYTFQLVATNVTYGTTYYLNTPVYGAPPLTFTTTGPGKAFVTSSKLKVKKGRVGVPVKCSKALACTGGVLDITTRDKGKKITCASGTFKVRAGKKKMVSTSKISAKCKALLVLAKKNTIDAHLTAGFDFQKGISKNVTLKLLS
jgi:hypothetical protein